MIIHSIPDHWNYEKSENHHWLFLTSPRLFRSDRTSKCSPSDFGRILCLHIRYLVGALHLYQGCPYLRIDFQFLSSGLQIFPGFLWRHSGGSFFCKQKRSSLDNDVWVVSSRCCSSWLGWCSAASYILRVFIQVK